MDGDATLAATIAVVIEVVLASQAAATTTVLVLPLSSAYLCHRTEGYELSQTRDSYWTYRSIPDQAGRDASERRLVVDGPLTGACPRQQYEIVDQQSHAVHRGDEAVDAQNREVYCLHHPA